MTERVGDTVLAERRRRLNELAAEVVDACRVIAREVGLGFSERIYQNALPLLLRARNLKVVTQARARVHFREWSVGYFTFDLLVEDCLIVELKVVRELLPIHLAQVTNYLRAADKRLGLLVNFGPRLEIKRVVNDF